jgi:hypothetical protein
MSVVEPGSASSGLVDRVKNILLKPTPTWQVIEPEPATVGSLYKGYVIPLALIPAICGLIGQTVFGASAFGITVKTPIVMALVSAVIGFGLSLVMVYVLGLIINALAPTFEGQKSQIQALKTATYSMTAGYVAGVLAIFPPLGILGALLGLLISLYGLYLLYTGLPVLMKAPKEKALPYTAIVVLIAIVCGFIIAGITGTINSVAMKSRMDAASMAGGEVSIGGQSVDLGKLQEASKQMEAAAKQMEAAANNVDGQGEAADPELLKGFLPASVAGFARSSVSSSSTGVGGLNGAAAEGSYAKGSATFKLTVTDLGAAGALAGMASAFNVSSSTEENGRYEKVGKVNGRMTTEEFDKTSGHGAYGVLVADRFMVQADGQGASIEDLKAAVGSVNFGALEALAKQAG